MSESEAMESNSRKMLVVGASGGIGSAVVAEATAEGWVCTCADRRSEFSLELSDRTCLELRLKHLFQERGPFDAVVFAAGVCPVAMITARAW